MKLKIWGEIATTNLYIQIIKIQKKKKWKNTTAGQVLCEWIKYVKAKIFKCGKSFFLSAGILASVWYREGIHS